MEKYNEKAERYNQLIRESDQLDYEISKLRATNAGINLSELTEMEIHRLQLRKEQIQKEVMGMIKDNL